MRKITRCESENILRVLELQEIFQNVPAVGVFFIEQFRMKLHAEKRTRSVLHRLDA